MKNVLNSLPKSVLTLLRLTAVATAANAAIHTKGLRSGKTTSAFWNKEMNDIIKIVNSLEESSSLIKGTSETIKNKGKEQKEEFLSMLLGTLCASLLGNLILGKGAIGIGEGTAKSGQYFQHHLIL